MTVRLKDIAKDCGVSVITVSKVLRDHPDIGAETRRRVLKRMKELNYQPNLAARALVTGKTMSAGLIVPDLVHPFFAEVAKGISAHLRSKGYGLLISSSEGNPDNERREISLMLARRVDALLIASAQSSSEGLKEMDSKGTPFVLLDRRVPGLEANFAGIDDEKAGYLAARHLYDAGCRRIGHVRGPKVSTGELRLAGFLRAIRELALPADWIAEDPVAEGSAAIPGVTGMRRLLEMNPRPDGVFCYNDPTALGAMRAVREAGLNVPGDVAILGCGNVLYTEYLTVPLSSVDQSSGEIGRRAAEMALSLVGVKNPPAPTTVLLEPRIVPRASTARRAAAG